MKIITLDVKPTGKKGRFDGFVDGKLIVTSRQPFCDAARVLRGYEPADALFQMRHSDGSFRLKSTLGAAAALYVDESGPRFRRWYPHYRSADAEHEISAAPSQSQLHPSPEK